MCVVDSHTNIYPNTKKRISISRLGKRKPVWLITRKSNDRNIHLLIKNYVP